MPQPPEQGADPPESLPSLPQGRPPLVRRRSANEERRTRSLGWLILVVVVIVLGAIGLAGARSYQDLQKARARADSLSEEIAQLERELDDLSARARRLEQDPAAIERAIRAELGLVAADEILIVLPEPR